MDEDFYRRQRELLTEVIREQDVVDHHRRGSGQESADPGHRRNGERDGRPGSVIVDIAAERGGNCELTRPGETVVHQGISILGPLNLPSTHPLSRQPDVCFQPDRIPEADGEETAS